MTRNYLSRKIEVRKLLTNFEPSSNAITLYDFDKLEVRQGIGKRKDTFKFNMLQPIKSNIQETYYNGDGTTTDFTLTFGPIDDEFLTGGNQKLFVFVSNVAQAYTTDYTISSSTLSFTSAPAAGVENIKVVFPVIEAGDLVRVYMNSNSETLGDSQVLIEGNIELTSTEISPNNTVASTFEGVGLIELLFSALAFVKDETLTAPENIINEVIKQVNNWNRLRTFGTANITTTGANIQYTAAYKSALEIIEEVSSDRYTKNGNYYYYVLYDASSDTYEFYWQPKSPELTAGLSIQEGVGYLKSLKVQRDKSEVINVIIYNVGLDCYEVPWEFLNIAQTSMVGQGAKWKYIMETNTIISDLLNKEFEADTTLFPTGTDGNRTSNFPTDTSSWSFQFEDRDDDGTKTGSAATATSDSEFNDAIVKEAMWIGKEATNRILDYSQAPRIKATAVYPFTTSYSLGNLVPVTSKSYNLNNYPLRVIEINHDDYDTTIELEEDEHTALLRIIEGA